MPVTGCSPSIRSRRARPAAVTGRSLRRCSASPKRTRSSSGAPRACGRPKCRRNSPRSAPILRAPRLGCLNVHASLLPRWRGAAPIQHAILAGDRESGVTIMQMEEGLDTGPILLQQAVPIDPEATATGLSAELALVGAKLLGEAIAGIRSGRLSPRPQPESGVTYAPKIGRDEGRLDWRQPAAALERRVRALNPSPGTFFEFRGERIRVLAAAALPPAGAAAPPGTVLDARLSIACGEGVLRPLRLQRPGRSPLEAPLFLRGFPIPAGTVLPCPATS